MKQFGSYPTGVNLFKVNDGNLRTICEICSKLAIKTPERRQCFSVSIFDFEQLNTGWDNRSLTHVTYIRLMIHSYRNHSIDLNCKFIDWFLYGCNIGVIWSRNTAQNRLADFCMMWTVTLNELIVFKCFKQVFIIWNMFPYRLHEREQNSDLPIYQRLLLIHCN